MRRARISVLLAFAVSAAAAEVPKRDPAFERYIEAVVDAAAGSRDARTLVAAASFAADLPWQPAGPALARKRDALGARAMQLGADDPVVWFVLAADCPLSKHACEAAHAVARLREVAPNNALGWLLQAPGDENDANFARATGANRYDTYEGEFVRALFEAASAVAPPEHVVAQVRAAGVAAPQRVAHVVLALGVAMTKGWPQLGIVNQRCGASHAREGAPREACIALARLMLNRSRDELAQRIGGRILVDRLPDGQERSDVIQKRRHGDWLNEKELEILGRDVYPASLLNWLHAGADRQSVRRAMLSENGVRPEPPAGWQPSASSVLPAPGSG